MWMECLQINLRCEMAARLNVISNENVTSTSLESQKHIFHLYFIYFLIWYSAS